jgi:F420-non-reducing hydrogenase iron-sulfur subunit
MAEFEPKIVGFCCNWCSYAGADLAGVSRIKQPPNLRIIRVMCSGRVEPEFVAKALSSGADGVLVLGCHIGDCHYVYGNHRTAKRITILKRILGYLGVDPSRIRLEWVSASEGPRFAGVVKEFTEEMKKLGPNPLTLKEVKAC